MSGLILIRQSAGAVAEELADLAFDGLQAVELAEQLHGQFGVVGRRLSHLLLHIRYPFVDQAELEFAQQLRYELVEQVLLGALRDVLYDILGDSDLAVDR